MLNTILIFPFLLQLGTDDFRNIMKAGSGGTGMTDDQKALLPKLKARGMAVLESCGEYDMLGTSSYRFFPEEDVIAHSADGTDQLGGGAACCEEINLVDGTVTIMCIDTAVADVAVNSLGRLDAVKDRERVTQLISCAHAASLHDYNKAARLPGFTFQLALEKMITFNAMRGNDKLHPFVVRLLICSPFYSFKRPFICLIACLLHCHYRPCKAHLNLNYWLSRQHSRAS
jgi:hypothetical protein